MEDGQRNPKQHLLTLEKEQVPESDDNVEVEVVSEEASEPLQTTHFDLEQVCFEVRVQLGQFSLEQLVDNLHVHKRTQHVCVVVDRHKALDHLRERPECLLLGHHLQQPAHDEVKSLAVSEHVVAHAISRADPLDCILNVLARRWHRCGRSYLRSLSLRTAFDDLLVNSDVAKELVVLKSARHVHRNLVLVLSRVLPVVQANQTQVVLARTLSEGFVSLRKESSLGD